LHVSVKDVQTRMFTPNASIPVTPPRAASMVTV